MTLDSVQKEYSTCTLCPELCSTRTQIVFGTGNENAKIVLIGEAPGATEDRVGIPFCGASGKVLEELLTSINLTRDNVFITNTIICRPPGNRNPKKEEISNCHERLKQTLEIIKPKVIVTVGNFATKVILPEKGKVGITKIRGTCFDVSFDGSPYKVVPVVHPANLLYNGRAPPVLEKMMQDFKVIGDVIGSIRQQKKIEKN
jgi:uracil-DNA glycosylase